MKKIHRNIIRKQAQALRRAIAIAEKNNYIFRLSEITDPDWVVAARIWWQNAIQIAKGSDAKLAHGVREMYRLNPDAGHFVAVYNKDNTEVIDRICSHQGLTTLIYYFDSKDALASTTRLKMPACVKAQRYSGL